MVLTFSMLKKIFLLFIVFQSLAFSSEKIIISFPYITNRKLRPSLFSVDASFKLVVEIIGGPNSNNILIGETEMLTTTFKTKKQTPVNGQIEIDLDAFLFLMNSNQEVKLTLVQKGMLYNTEFQSKTLLLNELLNDKNRKCIWDSNLGKIYWVVVRNNGGLD